MTLAASYGRLELVKIGLDMNIDIDAKCDGNSALWWALRTGSYDAAKFLIENGANTENMPLEFLATEKNATQIAELLTWLDDGNYLNLTSTSIQAALYFNNYHFMKKLLKMKPNVEFDYRNYFSISMKSKNYDMLQLLLEHGKKDIGSEVVRYIMYNAYGGLRYLVNDWRILQIVLNLGFDLPMTEFFFTRHIWEYVENFDCLQWLIQNGLQYEELTVAYVYGTQFPSYKIFTNLEIGDLIFSNYDFSLYAGSRLLWLNDQSTIYVVVECVHLNIPLSWPQ